MSVQQQTVEINSVETVLGELSPLIEEVQRTLERGLESEDPTAGSQDVAARLAEIRGTLQLLDLEGPSLLVDEMRVLAMELSLGRIESVEPALEALLKAIFRLPDYLDRLRAGHRDRPVVLLSLVNELRAARGADSLGERDVFRPKIEAHVPRSQGGDDSEIRERARRLRPRFQRALLGWYRGDDVEQHLGELGSVLQDLARSTGNPATQRLWQVCGALTESLADQGLEADTGVKVLMAKVERLLSQLVRQGEAALEQTIPLDLLRNLLYYVARSGSDSQRVREVKEAYHLEELLPDSETQADFEGPNRGLLEVVGQGIRDDLAAIRDAVEIYVHGDERRPEALEGLPDRLKQVADTFSMLGLNEDHDTLQREADALADVDSLGAGEAERRMQELADVLLRVDSDLTELQSGRPRGRQRGSQELLAIRDLPDSEYRPLLSAVVAASLDDLSKIREAVGTYCSDPDAGGEALAEVPALLREVEGALAMLPLDAARPMVRDLREYIEREFIGRGQHPDDESQVMVADVVAGIEYYLEAVDHDRAEMTHLLESASRAMQALQSGGPVETHDDDEQVVIESAATGGESAEHGDIDAADDGGEVLEDLGDLEDLQDEPGTGAMSADAQASRPGPGAAADEGDATAAAEAEPGVSASADRYAPAEPEAGAEGVSAATDTARDDAARGPQEAEGADGDGALVLEDFPADEGPPGAGDTTQDSPGTAGDRESDPGRPGGDAELDDLGLDEEFGLDAGQAYGDDSGAAAEAPATAAESTDAASETVQGGTSAEAETGDATGASEAAPGEAGGADLDFDDLGLDDDVLPGDAEQGGDEAPPDEPSTGAPAPSDAAPAEAGTTDAGADDSATAGPGVDPAASGSQYAIVGDDVDDEIVEVFLEEALGELDKINEYLPAWKQNPGDEESLIIVRRAFHTLKGGGRLIGAELIGEFSWSMENMLNRVIDHSIDATDAVFDTLDESSTALPQLIEQIRGNRAPIEGIDDLIERAHALSRGEEPPPGGGPGGGGANGGAPGAGGGGSDHSQDGSRGGETGAAGAEPEDAHGDATRAAGTAEEGDGAASAPEPDGDVDTAIDEPVVEDTLEGTIDPVPPAGADATGEETVAAESAAEQPAASGTAAGDSAVDGSAAEESAGEEETTDGGPERQSVTAKPVPGESAPRESVAGESVAEEPATAHAAGRQGTGSDTPADEAVARDDASGEAEASPAQSATDDDGDAARADGGDSLLQVFAREAQTHLDVLRSEFASAEAARHPVKESVRRALHTLVGSAQTAGCEHIADLASQMEQIVKARRDGDAELTEDDVRLFREGTEALDELVARLDDGGPSPDTGGLRERLDAQREEAESQTAAAQDEGENELLDIFLEEGDELLEECDRSVARWREQPEDPEVLADLQRSLHTLKGGARMASLPPIADLTHEVESVVEAIEEGSCTVDDEVLDLLQEAVDALTVLMEQARGRQSVSRVDWLLEDLRDLRERGGGAPAGEAGGAGAAEPDTRAAGSSDEASEEAEAAQPAQPAETASGSGEAETTSSGAAGESGSATGRGQESTDSRQSGGAAASSAQPGSDQIRVQSDLLDNLVNYAGEVSIYHSRLGEQMGQYRFNLNEFEQTVNRLRDQLRQMENETESQILHRNEQAQQEHPRREDFDPLEFDRYTRIQELSRSLAESVGDLDSIKEILENLTRDAETLLLQQSRVSSELQDGLMQTRMVRFDGLRARLSRVVRQTASQMGKRAQLTMSGGDLEVDRSIQERIVAPLEHVLRNAVAHGIEGPDERREAGKPEQGTIRLDLHRGGTDIILEVIDDGKGIDPDAVRRKGIERGLIEPDDPMDDNEVIKLILETGFSTADEVTQISGRGVGMDVVDAEIRRLGGTLGINTRKGQGTRFTVRLPVTLAINQAVLVSVGDDTYAIPIASIEGVTQVRAADLKEYYVDPSKTLRYAETDYRVQHLGSLLGTSEPRLDSPDTSYPVIMIRTGDDRVALHVDQLQGRREVVVKPLGAPLNMLPGISGATIMADGSVVLILDIGGLLRTESRFIATGEAAEEEAEEGAEGAAPAPTVLIVDDSITIRKVTQRILARNGIEVATAKDGVDALSWMQQSVPDLILLDIEMPRMDGYEVASHVKGEERLKHVPIIMITSRTGDKHRQRAEDIGVDHYLGKPYQEAELMEHISALIETPEAA